jgi:membrane protease YdiL (CAAX protease family)
LTRRTADAVLSQVNFRARTLISWIASKSKGPERREKPKKHQTGKSFQLARHFLPGHFVDRVALRFFMIKQAAGSSMWILPAGTDQTFGHSLQRRRAAIELLVVGILSIGFLALFPRRPILVDLSLALFALTLILLDVTYTRAQVWGRWPSEVGRIGRRRGVLVTMALTGLVVLTFLWIGATIGYEGAGWPGVRARILHPYIPTAVLLYLPWALIQQILFQFYLLGRVRMLFASFHPFALSALNGLIFGLVHATDISIVLLATLGGAFWSWLYLRYRLLWPLTVSHALIGTTFYYWVYGCDLASRWRAFLGGLLN